MTLDRLTARALGHPYWTILVAVGLVWGQTLRFDFVWDDALFIQQNEAVRSLRNVPRMFTSLDAQGALPDGFRVYRPLRTAQWALLHGLGGGQNRPWLFHLANLAWHAAAACLVFAVALRLLRARGGTGGTDQGEPAGMAMAAGLAFAVHPVLSEAVSWAKGLDDIMAAVFTLLATRLLLDWNGGWGKQYWAMAAAYVAAMYSKESAFPWVLFAALVFWRFHGRRLGQSIVLTLPLLGLALLSFAHRYLVLGRISQIAPISGTYAQTLIDMFTTVGPYLRLAAGIPPFCIDYSYMTGGHPLTSPGVLLGAGLLLVAGLLTLLALSSERARIAGLGGAWFLLFMLPVSNLVPMMQYMADRFLYLPLVGCVIAAADCLSWAPRRRLAMGLAAVGLSLWAVGSWTRSSIWKDDLTLFLRTYREGPRSARVEQNAISAILQQPHMRSVFRLNVYPDRLSTLELTTPAERAETEWSLVNDTARQLTALFPESAFANEAAGLCLTLVGQPRDGARALERAAALDPTRPNIWQNLGGAYLNSGQLDRAISAWEHSLQLAPDGVAVLRALGVAYTRKSDFGRAAAVYERLTTLEPGNSDNARRLAESRAKVGLP